MRTGIAYNHPLIPILRGKIETVAGHSISSQQQVSQLAAQLYLNEDTIRRIWGLRDSNYQHIRRTTLDILCQYVGFQDWNDFADKMSKNASTDSTEVAGHNTIFAEQMQQGAKVRIGWLPDRQCVICFCEGTEWIVEEVENSHTLRKGDRFRCSSIAEGLPLYLDDVTREHKTIGSVLIGKGHGIQSAQKL